MLADHGNDHRFSTYVTTPSTDNPDDAATTEASQSQQVRRGRAREGQRQDQTEKIQKTVAKTQGQIAGTLTVHPEVP